MGSYLLQQIAYSIPGLLAYLAGLILALIFIKKYPLPAMLTLVGSLILMVTTIGIILIQFLLFRSRLQNGWSGTDFNRMLGIVSIFGNILRALGVGFWLAAVFIGRKKQSAT